MKKVFFFDIDGTLAVNHYIPENNIKALHQLKESGYMTFICTGRAPFYAKKMFGDLVSGYICCNGRYILFNDHKLHGEAFQPEKLKWYLQRFKQLHLGALLVSDDVSMSYDLTDDEIVAMKKEYGSNHIAEYDEKLPVYTFDLFYRDIHKRDEMIVAFQKELVINDHHGCGHCDCSTNGYDKGNAIAFILQHFSIAPEYAYAFGDGYNDQAMFREVSHRIAMKNGVKELQDKATYITDEVDHDGIMKALIYFGIIDENEIKKEDAHD